MLKYTQAANSGDEVTRGIQEVLAQGKTAFQEYLFFRSAMHGICIALDGDIQSCESDEGLYHEALVHPAMLLHPQPRRVLIMGGGEGATAREVLRHSCVEQLVMVDIDKEFVELCQRWVPQWGGQAFADKRMDLRFQDINVYLDEADVQFDVVIGDLVDVHDWDSPVAGLYGADFYARLQGCMSEDAVLATQGGPLVGHDLAGHNRIRKTLAESFADVYSYGLCVPSFYHLWGYALAGRRPLESDSGKLLELFAARITERGLALPATGGASLAAAFALPQHVRIGLE